MNCFDFLNASLFFCYSLILYSITVQYCNMVLFWRETSLYSWIFRPGPARIPNFTGHIFLQAGLLDLVQLDEAYTFT
jgi:hypothetical protein